MPKRKPGRPLLIPRLPAEMFTKEEVQEYLRISRGTLDRIIERGELPIVKIVAGRRGRVLIRRRDLEKFIEDHLLTN